MQRSNSRLSVATAAAALVAAIAIPNGGTAAATRAHASAGCAPATNIEAIIDDSGSMAGTDPNTLRVKGLKLLINTLSTGTFLGAVEFGGGFFSSTPSADTVFKPEPVGPNAAAMGAALDSKIKADNGSTDYNGHSPSPTRTTPTPRRESSSPTEVTTPAPTTTGISPTRCRPT